MQVKKKGKEKKSNISKEKVEKIWMRKKDKESKKNREKEEIGKRVKKYRESW